MRVLGVVVMLGLSGIARAEDACDTLAGWNADACKADAAAASKVLAAAGTRLGELGDCSTQKKKADLLACAAEVSKVGAIAVSAGQVIDSHRGPKIARGNNNRMEAEDTDE